MKLCMFLLVLCAEEPPGTSISFKENNFLIQKIKTSSHAAQSSNECLSKYIPIIVTTFEILRQDFRSTQCVYSFIQLVDVGLLLLLLYSLYVSFN